MEELLGSELEEVIQNNRERLVGTAAAEQPMVEVLQILEAATQPKAKPNTLSAIMGQQTSQEWKKVEKTQSFGYNGQSSRTKRCWEKATRDKELEDVKLREG